MIRELTGLKVKAIAVEVNSDAINFSTIDDVTRYYLLGYKTLIKLTCDNWKILGRCNELVYGQIDSIYWDEQERSIPLLEAWKEYCANNRVTNELLLIME